jgi:hypothetical protein
MGREIYQLISLLNTLEMNVRDEADPSNNDHHHLWNINADQVRISDLLNDSIAAAGLLLPHPGWKVVR